MKKGRRGKSNPKKMTNLEKVKAKYPKKADEIQKAYDRTEWQRENMTKAHKLSIDKKGNEVYEYSTLPEMEVKAWMKAAFEADQAKYEG